MTRIESKINPIKGGHLMFKEVLRVYVRLKSIKEKGKVYDEY